jgi:formamidopyrimidine-DNA glycosylase
MGKSTRIGPVQECIYKGTLIIRTVKASATFMPYELPEILVLARQLDEVLVKKEFIDIDISERSNKLIEWGFINLPEYDLLRLKIDRVFPKGLFLFIHFENDMNLVFGHLIGKLLYCREEADIPEGYKINFSLNDYTFLILYTSLYSFAYAIHDNKVANHKYIGARGITPLEDGFTYDYFNEMLAANEKLPVKKIQSLYDYLAGFQNGYFQDFFFCAGILPSRKIAELSPAEKKKLYHCIISITREAVEQGGNSEDVDIYNTPGNYMRKMGSHLKGKPCKICSTVIQSSNLLGSLSNFCPGCQK